MTKWLNLVTSFSDFLLSFLASFFLFFRDFIFFAACVNILFFARITTARLSHTFCMENFVVVMSLKYFFYQLCSHIYSNGRPAYFYNFEKLFLVAFFPYVVL